MFGIGFPELIIILIVALVVVGPSKLPELAKTLGKAFNDFRRMADDVKSTIEDEVLKEEPLPEEDKKAEKSDDADNKDHTEPKSA
jgi:Tat protein translocase TatB subunit